jgi:signal transduction histidine kinase/DNA-binding NarL/FixJ family response regulator
MKIRNIINCCILGFVLGVAILIVAQYFVTDNIRQLIQGNEALILQYRQSNRLVNLEKDISILDYRLRIALTADSNEIHRLREDITQIQNDVEEIKNLDPGVGDSLIEINLLDRLINQKIKKINAALAQLRQTKTNLSVLGKSDSITQEISRLIHSADTTGRANLALKIEKADRDGRQVLSLNLIVVILILLLFIGLFLLILSRLKKQEVLVNQLNNSEKKLKEAALVKENFLSNMSHEIRTPLNAILGYTNLLQKKKLPADARLYLQTIHQSGETLLAIVNDILDLSKIESGMMRIEQVPFYVRDVAHTVELMMRNKADEKALKFCIIVDHNVPALLIGDATRLTQILVNLIGNAIKFTDQGHVTVAIGSKVKGQDFVEIEYLVEDTGIGIDRGMLDTIFERFRQAEDATTRKYGGTGLGLSIVRDLVHLQSGHIEIKSEINQGTKVLFTIHYPLDDQVNADLEATILSEPKATQDDDMLVLVVEDNVINQGLMNHLLNHLGVKYRLAANGKEALKLLQENNFDLVLMDIQMPILDGYATTREIRQTMGLSVPIVAMTAHAMMGEREKCISLGMNDHIAKPIRENELQRILTRYTPTVLPAKIHPAGSKVDNGKAYQYINLTYMREISNGDQSYEKLVTEQFIDLLPQELAALRSAFEAEQPDDLKKVAHGMKSTVAIMGLDLILTPHLDAVEYGSSDVSNLKKEIEKIVTISENALLEASQFIRQF